MRRYDSLNKKNLFDPGSEKPFKLSRTKIDLFVRCQRCFYLDRRLGVSRPPGYEFNLNIAVDELLKKEFDRYRKNGTRHPLMEEYGINAVPANHPLLGQWRDTFTGVEYLHQPTNLLVFGLIDDLWKNSQDEYHVVDYKATSRKDPITQLESYQDDYKRQMEIYQWLIRHNGLNVSGQGYFVYCNALKDREDFSSRLEFAMTLIPYQGDAGWVEKTIVEIKDCLSSENAPEKNEDCNHCKYREAVDAVLRK